MQLDATAHRALLDWIDLSTQLRRTSAAAKQEDLLERLRTVAADHGVLGRRITEVQEAMARSTAEAEKLDQEVADRSASIARMDDRLNAGTGLTSKDLLALQSDIDTARTALLALEDGQLAALESVETAQESLTELNRQREALGEQGRSLQAERKDTAVQLEAQSAELRAQRAETAQALPQDLRARLDQREASGAVAAAVVAQGGCGACGAQLSGVTIDALAGEPGRIAGCDDCEAVLVRQ